MHGTRNTIATTVLAGVLSVAGLGAAQAADTSPSPLTLKPISGQGTTGRTFLLNMPIGQKQAVSYFQNEGGLCRLTLMIGEAFNGEDVPDETVVRFEVKVDPARTALFNTAEGKGLEFMCLAGAQAMSVKTLDLIASYPPAM